jgi:hypothetical protein
MSYHIHIFEDLSNTSKQLPEPYISLSFIKEEDCKVAKLYRDVRVCTHSLLSLKSENRNQKKVPKLQDMQHLSTSSIRQLFNTIQGHQFRNNLIAHKQFLHS